MLLNQFFKNSEKKIICITENRNPAKYFLPIFVLD